MRKRVTKIKKKGKRKLRRISDISVVFVAKSLGIEWRIVSVIRISGLTQRQTLIRCE